MYNHVLTLEQVDFPMTLVTYRHFLNIDITYTCIAYSMTFPHYNNPWEAYTHAMMDRVLFLQFLILQKGNVFKACTREGMAFE